MADLVHSYTKTMLNEGGIQLTNVKDDHGGETYAGISRITHPDWIGWAKIDADEVPPMTDIYDFYREKFWNPLHGDEINNQSIADTLYDFAVNVGVERAVRIAQGILDVIRDGEVGPQTLTALNSVDVRYFMSAYCVGKIAYYRDIVSRNRSQLKFLLGWINRSLKGMF